MKIRVIQKLTKEFEVDEYAGKKLMKQSMSNDENDIQDFWQFLRNHGNEDWMKDITVERLEK